MTGKIAEPATLSPRVWLDEATLAASYQDARVAVLTAFARVYFTVAARRAGINDAGEYNISAISVATGASRAHVKRFLWELGLKERPARRKRQARKVVEK